MLDLEGDDESKKLQDNSLLPAEQPKKNPAFSLNKFFKPMKPEDKEKMLLSELAKVQ